MKNTISAAIYAKLKLRHLWHWL